MTSRHNGIFSRSLLPLFLTGAAACAVAPSDQADEAAESTVEDLTSLTARARTLKFAGVVYVSNDATNSEIVVAIRKQTQSGLGALRTADVGVNTRELRAVDPASFVKTNVVVVDPVKGGEGTPMLRVNYTYTDDAVVPVPMASRSALSLGLLNGDYEEQTERVLTECTDNDTHAREFSGSLWYVFDPSRRACKAAMATEQKAIDADRAKLTDPTAVPVSEVNRLYIPITVGLSGDKTNKGTSYPEYDRLYAGGVQPGKLVIGMVNGMMADWAAGEKHDTIDDAGYKMWFEGLKEIFKKRPTLALAKIEPSEDISRFTVGGKTITGVTFADILKWEVSGTGFPASITTAADKRALRVAAGNKLAKHWVTFESKVNVTIGAAEAKDVTIQLNTYFGAETSSAPYKRAIKNSDVFVYNGHSYIGYGPLDPSNFSARDFPASYQILFVNGCVSYNYYEKDYFPLKAGGTKNLELVTNGLESWVDGSGPAMGRFVGALIDGKQESYANLLKASQFTQYGYSWGMDALRVVDGEVDNKYSPTVTPITVR
jgi:hypothetical protein